MRTPLAILALVCTLPSPALPAPVEVGGRVSLGPAWDSNATRAVSGAGPAADEALRLLGDVEVRFAPAERLSARAAYRGGLDDFRVRVDQDRGAHDLSLGGAFRATERLAPGLEGRARLRRTRDDLRDATDLSTAATLKVGPVARAAATLRLGLRRFDFADAAYSFRGPFAGASLRWEPVRRHVLSVGYEVSARAYPTGRAYRHPGPEDEAFISGRPVPAAAPERLEPGLLPPEEPAQEMSPLPPETPGPSALGRRHDLAHTAGLSWTWKGPAILGGGYTFSRVDSNGYGFDADRHRFQLHAAVRLPGELVGTGQAVLQLVRFPDGIYVSDELLLVDDEENLSSVSLQLSRALGERLSAEVRYAAYLGSFQEAGLRYERHVAGAAMTFRF